MTGSDALALDLEESLVDVEAANARLREALEARLAATAERDLAVVTAYAAGASVGIIAARMGVRTPIVSRILTRALKTEETTP
jgi:alkyl hydroperoxide reductase subunit AhpF